MTTALAILLLAYLPGAVLFRAPIARRSMRAALPFEERVFWSIALSLLQSALVGLLLAIAGWYDFHRLVLINAALTLAVVVASRARLRLGPDAAAPTWMALIPLAIVIGGFWVIFRVPPAEYVMGGRDPGTYLNEGIRLAQRGGAVTTDEVARSVPPPLRPLFFPPANATGTYTARFMAFFLLDADAGAVVGQFPPGFPLWVAIGYGINGVSGARAVTGFCALFGLLAVYFAGARVVGRAAAAAGAGLLAINVAEVWYARDPNAEILLQPIVFAGLLAYMRAAYDDDAFFAPVGGLLLAFGAFTHVTGAMAAAALGGAAAFHAIAGRGRVPLAFWLPLAAGTVASGVYLWWYIPPYFDAPLGFVQNLGPAHIALAVAALVAGVAGLGLLRRFPAATRDTWSALTLTALVWALAAYAYFFRTASGTLGVHDADSLRTFTALYLSPYALAAALAGFAVVARRFSANSAFLLLLTGMSVFFFYKIRIVPEHFWAARRILAVILPGVLLLVGAAAFSGGRTWATGARIARYGAGVILILVIGVQYVRATQPILHHVEYAGLIPRLEFLASTIGDEDLLLVESRGNSDTHVLALPLAYVYARNVLVFAAMAPLKAPTREFIAWAQQRYRRVMFLGSAGGGVDLLWRSFRVGNVATQRFQIPEYELALNAFPRRVKYKEFDLVRYEFLREPVDDAVLTLDVGGEDDPYIQAFHAKERQPDGTTFRWTREVSHIAVVGLRTTHRELTLWMSKGGRPPQAGPATVRVFLDDHLLGEVVVGPDFTPYRLAIPADLADTVGRSDPAAHLRLVTSTWSPARLLGGSDTRDLGVALDRVDIR